MRHSILPLVSLFLCHGVSARTWTDSQNRKIEAELVKVNGDSVVLKLADGRELPYPLAKLSPEDRKVVEESRGEKGAEASEESTALNFDAPWPDSIRFTEDPEINTVEEDAEKKSFIYESAHYRYICDVRLARSVVKGFAVMFEATYLYCRTLPLAINGGTQVDGKFQILLFETKEAYIAAGGPPSSAGVFIGRKNAVLVPLDSLGVKPVGSSYMLDRDKSSNTIPHELTHQLSPRGYFVEGAMGWFSEGIAEYVAVTPYRAGNFNVRGNQRPIMEYVTGYGAKDQGGRALGTEIKMPALKAFMMQDYASFQEEPQLGYGCGLLLVTYFLHMDGAGDGKRMKAYLKALHDGKEGEEALAVLLDGRSFEQMQEEIIKAWSRKGVDFSFAGS
ncbi:MAG: SHD1 domain-containing protein [Verrucomicrobiota bacterium]